MTGFRLAPQARADIQEICTYIADDSLEAAGRVRRAFLDSCRLLAKHPRIGHKRADLTTRGDVLFWPVYSYLIVYRPRANPLQILRVLHGKRDVRSVLR
jgi:plasmid stabilization system protein ParE